MLTAKQQKCDSKLFWPQSALLSVVEKFSAQFTVDGENCVNDAFVVTELSQPLLGWPAILSLFVLKSIQGLNENKLVQMHPNLFIGLGTIKWEYDIVLKDGAKPFYLAAPRRVPLPLRNTVNDEIKRLLETSVISAVTEPTDWCARIVVVPEKDGRVRICLDYTHLNKSVLRKRHMLAAVDEALAKLANANFFET